MRPSESRTSTQASPLRISCPYKTVSDSPCSRLPMIGPPGDWRSFRLGINRFTTNACAGVGVLVGVLVGVGV